MEGEREGEEGVVGPEDLEEVERVAEGGQGQGDALVHERVPQPHLAPPQALEGKETQREELLAEVPEVERSAGQRPAQEGQEGDERDQGGREGARAPSSRTGGSTAARLPMTGEG